MPGSLAADVKGSISIAATNADAFDGAIEDLTAAVARRQWDKVETIRATALAAIDAYFDNIVAAAKRVDYERAGS